MYGGGAVEIELARMLIRESQKTPGLDQYAIRKFAEALEGTLLFHLSCAVFFLVRSLFSWVCL